MRDDDAKVPDGAFTEDEIKRAFWATFHKRGEVWFDHLSGPEACHESTADKWDGFVENLREQLKKRG